MYIIIQTSLMPTASINATCVGSLLMALSQGQEPCHSVPTKAMLGSGSIHFCCLCVYFRDEHFQLKMTVGSSSLPEDSIPTLSIF